MANEHAFPVIFTPQNYPSSPVSYDIAPQDSAPSDMGYVAIDPALFPSSLSVSVSIPHRAYTCNIALGGLLVDHSLSPPPANRTNVFTCGVTASPILNASKVYRLPISNRVACDTTDDGYTITGGIHSSSIRWGTPSQYYTSSNVTQTVVSGQTFSKIDGYKIETVNSTLTADFGFMGLGGLKQPIFLSFRRNATNPEDVTGVSRVWEARLFARYTWSGNFRPWILSGGSWFPAGPEQSYTHTMDSMATYLRTITDTDKANCSPVGTYDYLSGSGSNPSAYIADLARNDVLEVTGVTL